MSTQPYGSLDDDRGLRRVTAWRRRHLERAGFAAPLADALARDAQTDIHALLELVDRGCTPELAARILAPVDYTPEWPR